MKPRISINMHYMELGGAERALLGLLEALDTDRFSVDLLINQHTGPFMPLIPGKINLLPEMRGYNAIERPMRDIVLEGQWRVAWARWKARKKAARYHAALPPKLQRIDASVFQFVADEVTPVLPDLRHLGTYDLAISFLTPHNVVLQKVDARRRLAWIHTDYSTIHVNAEQELPIWDGFDHIVSISPDCTKAFLSVFPTLKEKIIEMENILPLSLIRHQAKRDSAPEIIAEEESVRLLSIGRICYQKNFDCIPQVAKRLKELGLKFVWYVVGPGDHADIDREAAELGVADNVRFLGPKENPYPYIRSCDIYLQPSRYEGKSVTVREAQVLRKPVIITRYATAESQIRDGVDGVICDLDNEAVAHAIYDLANNAEKQQQLITHLASHDYAGMAEVEKIYDLIQ